MGSPHLGGGGIAAARRCRHLERHRPRKASHSLRFRALRCLAANVSSGAPGDMHQIAQRGPCHPWHGPLCVNLELLTRA
jgi:hypothetical protein